MKGGLQIKFNHKAKKEIKTENDIKVGVRKRADGSLMYVRGGKIVGESKQAKRQEAVLNEYRAAATEATARKNQLSREHHKPKFIQPYRAPTM